MEWLGKVFSAPADPSRVNPAGIALMAAALVLALLSGKISHASGTKLTQNAVKLIALVICAGGALLAILG